MPFHLLAHFIFVILLQNQCVFCIDCFKCISVNAENKACEDIFHNNYSTDVFESPCMGGRKGRDGVYPATHCVKINGKFDDNGETITVRGCALDSGTLTTDTEIVRMSHCGGFYYNDRYARGCVQSCNDADGCNAASTSKQSWNLLFSPLFLIVLSCRNDIIK